MASDYPCILLEGCALLPFQVMPLHLFEPRYRKMVEDALASDRRFAVAEAVEAGGKEMPGPWATLGRILSHQALPDGRHLVLLEGEVRLKVDGLAGLKPYPKLKATEVPDSEPGSDAHISVAKNIALVERILAPGIAEEEVGTLIERLRKLAATAPGKFADAAAGHLLEGPEERRRLLSMTDPDARLVLLRQFLLRLETENQLGPSDPGFDPRVN
jgi:Lon protease-like protein